MKPNNTLRLDQLTLTHFRCFSECTLELHPELTVLVADNAQGKTALMNAICITLDVFVSEVGQSPECTRFDRSDIHLVRGDGNVMVPEKDVAFAAEGVVDGVNVRWARGLSSNSPKSRNTTKDLKSLKEAVGRMRTRLDTPNLAVPVLLPCLSFYGTGRLWDELRLTKGKRWLASANHVRVSAYLDCLSPSSSYKAFADWYEATARNVRGATSKAFSPDERPELQLAAVRKAVATVLEPTGWTAIDWAFPAKDEHGVEQGRGYLAVEHAARGRLPVSWLSDGVRNMIALVGDLAHRCARLNPHLGEDAARDTPGVLLIDEVDMHLHPKWQQLVVKLLQDAFPSMQMIFTTHSPHVLTTIRKENIRIIEQTDDGTWSVQPPKHSPLGQESSDALAFVMRADPRPPLDLLDDVEAYEKLARLGKAASPEAIAILEKLSKVGFEFSGAQTALFALLTKRSEPKSQ